jgi:uncharacterized protein GlcG (DUF336 family)
MLGLKKTLTLAAAKRVAAAAAAEAVRNYWNVVITIVDDAGYVLYMERLDGAQLASVEVATRKARAAALFKRPTKVFEDMVAGGRAAMLALPGSLPLEGGLPLEADGQVLGAIGVSGVTAAQDGQIARAGAEEFARIAKES